MDTLEDKEFQPQERTNLEAGVVQQEQPNQSTYLHDDPDFERIQSELNDRWLQQHPGETRLNGNHQDYLFGNPADVSASTLDIDARMAFQQEYPEKYAQYEENERVRAYDDIGKDPAFERMQKRILKEVNRDGAVLKGEMGAYERVYAREQFYGAISFATRFPEKTAAYAKKWDQLVLNHPELDSMDNDEWRQFLFSEQSTGISSAYTEYRMIAGARDHIVRQKEIKRQQEATRRDARQVAQIKEALELQVESTGSVMQTALSRDILKTSEQILKEVAYAIRIGIPAEMHQRSQEVLQQDHERLAEEPFIPGQLVGELLQKEGEDEGMQFVSVDSIVGTESVAFQNWSTEYDNRKGRAIDVAEAIMEGSEEGIEQVFHTRDPEQGIKLKKIAGPEGDIFFVADGTHRVAGAKLSRIPEIPAQVESMVELSEVRTTERSVKDQWEKQINMGLIDGTVEQVVSQETGETSFQLTIKDQVLPWITLPQHQQLKMSQLYCNRYPHAFDNLKSLRSREPIPKEVLTDEIAMNFFLAGRWNEYLAQNKKDS